MTAPSYNNCHNGLSRPSNDNAWNSSYPDIPWASTACYPIPGMGVGQNLLHSSPDSSSNSSIPPLPTSPCHTSAAIPASSYQPNRVAWPVGSQSGYIIPDIHNPTCQSNTPTNSSLTRIPSFSSSQEESPETMGVGSLCGHGAIAHSRQASSIEYALSLTTYHL